MASVFSGLSNTSFTQSIGIVGMTEIMSRHAVMIGAIIFVTCGFRSNIGAVVASLSLPVLGGGAIRVFGMMAAVGLSVLATVTMKRKNMLIIVVSRVFGFGLRLVPTAVQYLLSVLTPHIMAVSGLLPSAIIAIVLNQVLPKDIWRPTSPAASSPHGPVATA